MSNDYFDQFCSMKDNGCVFNFFIVTLFFQCDGWRKFKKLVVDRAGTFEA